MYGDAVCGILVPCGLNDEMTHEEMCSMLESGTEENKVDVMKRIIVLMSNGEPCSELLIYIIRFVMPSQKNKIIKRLLLIYFEICEKVDARGKLKQEMILVCNALRNDLKHANEYVRGSTLRLFTRFKVFELIEPLLPSIYSNLEHRHQYVRKNAILAVYSIYKEFGHLVSDIPDILYNFLDREIDPVCIQTSLFCLSRISIEKSLDYFKKIISNLLSLDCAIHMAFVDFVRLHIRSSSSMNSQYLEIIDLMLNSGDVSNCVKVELAHLLSVMTGDSNFIHMVHTSYIDIISKETNNNIKLVILDRVEEIRSSYKSILQDNIAEIFKVTSSSDIKLKKKCLSVIADNINDDNGTTIMNLLKRELESSLQGEQSTEYQCYLVSTISKCSLTSESLVLDVVPTITGLIVEKHIKCHEECMEFLVSASNKFESLRKTICWNIVQSLKNIRNVNIFKTSLWIIGEYLAVDESLRESLEAFETYIDNVEEHNETHTKTNKHSDTEHQKKAISNMFFDNGDIQVPSCISLAWLKISVRLCQVSCEETMKNEVLARILLVLVRIMKLLKGYSKKERLNIDLLERIGFCIRVLSSPKYIERLQENFKSLGEMEEYIRSCNHNNGFTNLDSYASVTNTDFPSVDALCPLDFRLLNGSGNSNVRIKDTSEQEIATIQGIEDNKMFCSSQLDRSFQLTGFSDALYVECFIHIIDLDVTIETVIKNISNESIGSIVLEFVVHNGPRIVIPSPLKMLEVGRSTEIRSFVKIYSIDQTRFYGSISYDTKSTTKYMILNTITLDICHFLSNRKILDNNNFSSAWKMLEWENKICLKMRHTKFSKVMEELLVITNFRCLYPDPKHIDDFDDCEIFSSNLYSLSKLGDEILGNVSLEKSEHIVGHIRLRSKSNSLVYLLGNKISQNMGFGVAIKSNPIF